MDAYEKEQRAKRAKARKLFPALAAITAAVVCLPAGVYAYELYHKESVQKYIGISGEQILMESGYSAPQSFSNDKATLTIDTMLYDGYAALAVVTIEAHDPAYTLSILRTMPLMMTKPQQLFIRYRRSPLSRLTVFAIPNKAHFY